MAYNFHEEVIEAKEFVDGKFIVFQKYLKPLVNQIIESIKFK